MDLQKLLQRAGLELKRVELPPSSIDVNVGKQIARYQLIYSLSGLILGLACVGGGLVLSLRGITGSASWTGKVLGLESVLSDAAPGVVLFILGLFVVYVTRFSISIGK